jgi:hypothetical protein
MIPISVNLKLNISCKQSDIQKLKYIEKLKSGLKLLSAMVGR